MELTKYEQDALDGNHGDALETSYRILVAVGEATDATKLIPIQWAHVSGVNYNTIGNAGAKFLSEFSETAKTRVMTTLNPTGYDIDQLQNSDIDENFIHEQDNINNSYVKMGVTPSFSCIPYDIYKIPNSGTQVAFAESNAAIHANSVDHLKTNKESAFSALASAITGKSIYSNIRNDDFDSPEISVKCQLDIQNELECGILGYYVGQTSKKIVDIDGSFNMNEIETKSLCGGIGTSGQCVKYTINNSKPDTEKINFDKNDFGNVYDKLNTSDDGDLIAFGSPQLGMTELLQMSNMLKNKKFTKPCMIFCPRMVKNQANVLGFVNKLKRAGCEICSDCCMCFTPLLTKKNLDSVITNSVKGSYYLNTKNKLHTNLKPLKQIINENTTNS